MNNNNYYELLGVATSASPEEIKSAYEAKLDKLSPENFRGHRQFANAQIKLLKKAFNVLKNADKKNSPTIESDQSFELPETLAATTGHANKDKQWQGFYSDNNIRLILLAAKSALDSANQHLETYPLSLTQNFSIARMHSLQAANLQISTQSLIHSIKDTETPDEQVRNEYVEFIKTIDAIAADKEPSPLAKDLKKKDIIDTLSKSISFTLFNKATPRQVSPIKKSMDKYLSKVTSKLKVPKPRKRR